jgi:hypothetical protein
VLGIVRQENNSAELLRLVLGFGEENHGTAGLAHERAGDISEKWPQHDFLLQGSRHQQIDFIRARRFQDRSGRVFALLIMNRGIFRQGELTTGRGKLAASFFIAVPDVDELKLLAKPIPDAFPFRQHLEKSRRKSARHTHGPIRRLDHVFARILCWLR